MKRLLIVYHTQGGRTGAMAEAVLRGARRAMETETVMKRAGEATLDKSTKIKKWSFFC